MKICQKIFVIREFQSRSFFAKIILHYRTSALPFTVEIDFFLTHWGSAWHEISNHFEGVRLEAFLFKSSPVNNRNKKMTILAQISPYIFMGTEQR